MSKFRMPKIAARDLVKTDFKDLKFSLTSNYVGTLRPIQSVMNGIRLSAHIASTAGRSK